MAVTDKDLVSRHGFVLLRALPVQFEISIESSPNVEYGKMRSEPDECALGADFRVIDSTFYFSWDASPIALRWVEKENARYILYSD